MIFLTFHFLCKCLQSGNTPPFSSHFSLRRLVRHWLEKKTKRPIRPQDGSVVDETKDKVALLDTKMDTKRRLAHRGQERPGSLRNLIGWTPSATILLLEGRKKEHGRMYLTLKIFLIFLIFLIFCILSIIVRLQSVV